MKKISPRTIWILFADAVIIYGGIITAMYLRLGVSGSSYELNQRNGWFKIGFAVLVCLLVLYFYDLYEFTVMNNRLSLIHI